MTVATDERTPLLNGSNRQDAIKPTDGIPASELPPAQNLPLRQKWAILLGCSVACALGAIDTTIVATLVLPIANSFKASHEASWLGTSFLLSNITFTPLYGRLCDILGRRMANASAIALFAIGTFLCATAPNMKMLILARFIAGAGGGGMNTTSAVISADLFSLRQRGIVSALSILLWAVGGALGGPLGGFIADRFGWRMTFTFQVPLLVICLISGLLTINYPVPSFIKDQPLKDRLKRIDFLGCFSIFIAFGAWLLALSLRRNELLPWSDWRLILSTVLVPIFLVIFVIVEAKVAVEPVLPFRLLAKRTPLAVCGVTIFVAVCNFGMMYHLPIFFLALEGSSSSAAGAHLVPTSIGNVAGGVLGGLIMHRTGRYWWANAFIAVLPILAVATITFMKTTSPEWIKWVAIGPLGFGFGFILNTTMVALMASVSHSDIPAITGVQWLFRTSGQVVGVATTSAVLQGVLTPQLIQRITGPHASKIIQAIREDASIIPTLPAEIQQAARSSYAVALRWTYAFCGVCALLAWLSCLATQQVALDAKAAPKQQDDATVARETDVPVEV